MKYAGKIRLDDYSTRSGNPTNKLLENERRADKERYLYINVNYYDVLYLQLNKVNVTRMHRNSEMYSIFRSISSLKPLCDPLILSQKNQFIFRN